MINAPAILHNDKEPTNPTNTRDHFPEFSLADMWISSSYDVGRGRDTSKTIQV